MSNAQLKITEQFSILYVEDDDMVREIFTEVLRRRFKEVYIARDGQEGIELYQDKKPDLILSDLQMPRLDGLGMIKHIRAHNREIPIILNTAFSETKSLIEAIALKVDRVIEKPTTNKELSEALVKSCEVLYAKKALFERDKIIETILGWHPYFSIISDGENVSHIATNLLRFLGYETKDEFIAHHENLHTFLERINGFEESTIPHANGKSILEYLSVPSNKENIIYLKSAIDNQIKAYLVKSCYFSSTGLYLMSFFDPKFYVNKVMSDSCESQNLCNICKFEQHI